MSRPLIVVTDTDSVFLEVMAEILEDEGYDAITMKETDNVFGLIQERLPALVIIELVISDPERGWILLNKMRLDRKTTTIPVIIASTSTELVSKHGDYLRAKGCDILIKPFTLEELFTMVEQSIHPPAT